MTEILSRVVVGGLGLVGLFLGLYGMLWYRWLSSGPHWEHQSVGIMVGFLLSTLWSAASMLLVMGAVYSYTRLHRAP